jgi:hypothetical protein
MVYQRVSVELYFVHGIPKSLKKFSNPAIRHYWRHPRNNVGNLHSSRITLPPEQIFERTFNVLLTYGSISQPMDETLEYIRLIHFLYYLNYLRLVRKTRIPLLVQEHDEG